MAPTTASRPQSRVVVRTGTTTQISPSAATTVSTSGSGGNVSAVNRASTRSGSASSGSNAPTTRSSPSEGSPSHNASAPALTCVPASQSRSRGSALLVSSRPASTTYCSAMAVSVASTWRRNAPAWDLPQRRRDATGRGDRCEPTVLCDRRDPLGVVRHGIDDAAQRLGARGETTQRVRQRPDGGLGRHLLGPQQALGRADRREHLIARGPAGQLVAGEQRGEEHVLELVAQQVGRRRRAGERCTPGGTTRRCSRTTRAP